MLYFIFSVILVIFCVFGVSVDSYAWGPGVHINISISILEYIDKSTASMLLANLNEYLYGSLAPDFILGKKYSKKEKNSHCWDVAFDIFNNAKTEKEKSFAYGYLTHLSADSVAHSIMIPKITQNSSHKNIKHFFIENCADARCGTRYKELAKKTMQKYNNYLDNQFKYKVDSVLFSFAVSKLIFKSAARISFSKKSTSVMLNEKLIKILELHTEELGSYVELSKKFTIDIVSKLEKSSVAKISAISK